jgi:hypothetical protein
MLSSAIVVFSVSSVSEFQRREDDAVAALVHGPGAVTPLWGHDLGRHFEALPAQA